MITESDVRFVVVFSLFAFMVPLVVNGPVAAKIYLQVLKNRDEIKLARFWTALLISNIIGGFFISITGGHAGPGPGTCAYCALPISSFVTVQIMRHAKDNLFQTIAGDERWQGAYSWGIVFIPLLPYIAPIFSGIFVLLPLCTWLIPLDRFC